MATRNRQSGQVEMFQKFKSLELPVNWCSRKEKTRRYVQYLRET